ncbi:MAG TPA: inorganic diphosphatase [Patescibacteria group bacterium]
MFHHIKIGDNSPRVVNAIIEIPRDTHNKYEYDETLDVIRLDRVLHSPMHYPVDYGFIPGTRSLDGDHLDVMVITDSSVFSGCLLEVRPLGVLLMADEHGIDEKIIAVPLKNPNYDHFKKFSQIAPHFLLELEHFFSEYKRLEYKNVTVKGWKNRLEAYKIIRAAKKRFQDELKVSAANNK